MSAACQAAQIADATTAESPAPSSTGSARNAQPLGYTALGDSIATGTWASAGYVDRYADRLRAEVNPSVQLTNLAVNGWTTSDLLNALRTSETYRSAVQGSDVITVSIGGNDLLRARERYLQGTCGGPEDDDCLRTTTDRVLANWDAILDELQALVGSRPVAIRTMDVYNPYAGRDAARLDLFKPYLDEINSYLCLASEARGIPCARVYAAFNGSDGTDDPAQRSLIAFDGLHPSDQGHALIADLLCDLDYAPLR